MRAAEEKARQETEDPWLRPRSLHPDAASFLGLLARTAHARAVMEVGTSVGFSTIHLARAGLSGLVTQRLGDAPALLPTLPGPWDLVFLDPEKELYVAAWLSFKDHVRPGGLVVADNLLSHAEDLAGYREAVRADGRFDTVLVPLGLGLEVSYRRF